VAVFHDIFARFEMLAGTSPGAAAQAAGGTNHSLDMLAAAVAEKSQAPGFTSPHQFW
jgi:hypothetical protein